MKLKSDENVNFDFTILENKELHFLAKRGIFSEKLAQILNQRLKIHELDHVIKLIFWVLRSRLF